MQLDGEIVQVTVSQGKDGYRVLSVESVGTPDLFPIVSSKLNRLLTQE
jgi:hypothetical protein